MKKFFVTLMWVLIVAIATALLIAFWFTHRTRYLNFRLYSAPIEAVSSMKVPSEIKLKGYPDSNPLGKKFPEPTVITDKAVIKKVVDYLNSIPLVYAHSYFDERQRVHIITDLAKSGYDFIRGGNGKSGSLTFYDDKGLEIGSVQIYNDEYIVNINYQAYKVRDKGTRIISGLEELDLN